MFSLHDETSPLTEIAQFNDLFDKHIKTHILDPRVTIRYDEPDPENPPVDPTFHLFMYLVHEDLTIRHSLSPAYDASSGGYGADSANIRCLYLVTYWEGTMRGGSDSPRAAPDSQSVLNLTEMVRALLCIRKNPAFKAYQLKVIEPEALNSLGNFWQALNNKPRTIINFAVTIPMNVDCLPGETVQPITTFNSEVGHLVANGTEQLKVLLRNTLRTALGARVAQTTLAKVVIEITPGAEVAAGIVGVELAISGMTWPDTAKIAIETELERWKSEAVDFPVGGSLYRVTEWSGLLMVPASKKR